MKIFLIVTTMLIHLSIQHLKAQTVSDTPRVVQVQGASNFRDVGGYRVGNGKQVKWGKIYRSAAIDKLTDSDLDTLTARKINTVIDFRGNNEAAGAPDRLPENTNYILLPAGSSQTDLSAWFRQLNDGKETMKSFYTNTEVLVPRYKPFFNQLLQLPDDQALLFHCTAGKDRTGIATALFLYALGVDSAQIWQDYLATNLYGVADRERQIQKMEAMGLPANMATDLMTADSSYLLAFFQKLQEKYGSVDHFLKNEIGLTKENIRTLKEKYLEKE